MFLLLMVVLALFAGRLVQLQGVQSASYAQRAKDQRLRTETLVASRGAILDRNGAVLAQDVAARAVTADPTLVRNKTRTAQALAPLVGAPAATLLGRLTVAGRYALLAQGLTPAQGKAVTAAALPGIFVIDSSQRVYPDGNLAAGVLGFTGLDGKGHAGLEYADNQVLTGRNGQLTLEVDPAGRQIPDAYHHIAAAVPGDSLELTLDRNIQWMAQNAITQQVAATKARSGMVLVMQPSTGAILAMASTPGFNPSAPPPNGANTDEPAVSSVYEPGSVNKVVMASAALESGIETPNSPITVPPTLRVDGTTFHDAEPHGVEHLTLTGVLAQSSNLGTIEIAQKLGRQRLYSYLRKFGLGSITGAGLPGESPGLLPPPSQWSGTQAVTIPFGQGLAVTALQVASMYCTVANGGVRAQPHIVQAIVHPDGTVTRPALAAPRRVIQPNTSAELRNMLQAVTTTAGTAPEAAIPGYLVAGKTGTSNAVGRNGLYNGGYLASFVGMAPADNPQLVVEVVLNQPTTSIYGGAVAAPVFRRVMGFALQSLHIAPTGAKPPALRIYS